MSKLSALTPKRVIRASERGGFYLHHVRGSHYFLRKAERNVVIRYHTKDLKPGTLRAIIDQPGLTVDEFLALL